MRRALELKDKVDRSECLDDFDLGFLNEVFADANNLRSLVARHREYQELVARMVFEGDGMRQEVEALTSRYFAAGAASLRC